MAKPTKSIIPLLLLLFVLFTVAATAAFSIIGRKVGGRTRVKNVKENKEIQELGRYCVREDNSHMQHEAERGGGRSASKLLVFSEVVEAETQVVSGIKYYLKIAAASRGAAEPTTFEAVALVKPWLNSKELLDFAPSPPPTNTK